MIIRYIKFHAGNTHLGKLGRRKMLYGGGLRLMECLRLGVQDIDIERGLVYVRASKGGKDRTTVLSEAIQSELLLHIEKVKHLHDEDLAKEYGEVCLPGALFRKYPHAGREFRRQFVFPSKNLSSDLRINVVQRHHVLGAGLQKAVKTSVERAD